MAEPTAAFGSDAPTDPDYRIEHDTMGEVRVPARWVCAWYAARAVENFPISGRGLERGQIRALALIKAAAAKVNAQLGVVETETASAIASAAARVAAGDF